MLFKYLIFFYSFAHPLFSESKSKSRQKKSQQLNYNNILISTSPGDPKPTSNFKTDPESSRTPSLCLCRPHVYISIQFGGPVSHYRICVASGQPGKGCMCFLTERHTINVQRNFNLKRSFSSSHSCCWSPRVLVLQPVNYSSIISTTGFDLPSCLEEIHSLSLKVFPFLRNQTHSHPAFDDNHIFYLFL